ncbi:VQ [Zea mays]|jgi:hypothetical protein|uniref:VQ n=1 Tax=Zea mays TaxID=4577 RepID=B6UIL9_MAIZE|nr:VQ [Zea mays]ACG49202.1 VQ [Zea mays]AQK38804.1 VQ [Zea mays]|eukprot:NP_001152733.1 VQ [Zea mays]
MLMAAATHYLGGSAHSSSTTSSSISPSPPPWHPVLVVPSNQRQAVVYDLTEDLATPPSPSPSPSTTPQHLRPASRRRAGKPRRPRPSRKLPTTYISADAASFRRMVHQVTGAGVGADVDAVHQGTEQLLCRPAPPSRAVLSTATTTLVPTLDTSAFLLDAGGGGRPGAACFHGSAAAAEAEACGCGGGGGIGGGGEYSCSNGGGGGFPSLESWDDHDLF